MREARQLGRYGVSVSAPVVDYPRLLARVREVVDDVRAHSALRAELDAAGVTVHERAGTARFVDPHTIETRWAASHPRRQDHSVHRRSQPTTRGAGRCVDRDAQRCVEPDLGAAVDDRRRRRSDRRPGRFDLQRVSNEGAAVPGGPPHPDGRGRRRVAMAVADVRFEARRGSRCATAFGAIEAFEKTPAGVRMMRSPRTASGALSRGGVGGRRRWAGSANTAALGLAVAGVETDRRGFVRVDAYLRTTAPDVFAAGDITGRLMLVPQAMQAGFVAGDERRPRVPRCTVERAGESRRSAALPTPSTRRSGSPRRRPGAPERATSSS